MTARSPLFTDIDFDRNGKQISFLNLPFSPHSDAWGVIPIPIACIRNGSGPTVLLMGGNHGDEYEGPIVLGRLLRDLDPAQVQGRLIFVPAINLPAVVAGRRTSPVDDRNFNRSFPGDPEGTPTQQIAHYVESVLMPMADVFIDLHSGGSSLNIVPSCLIERSDNPGLHARVQELALAFDAPLTVVMDTLGETRTAAAAAVRRGLVSIGSELGSAGAVSLEALEVGARGVHNVLYRLGVLQPPGHWEPAPPRTRLMEIAGTESYVYAPANGIWEPYHALWTEVEAGQPAGALNFLDDPGRAPLEAAYRGSGLLYARRAPGLSIRGNCVAVLLNDYKS